MNESLDKLREELAGIGRQIIELEERLQGTHEESGGNSPEDNAQESQADLTTQAIFAEKIQGLREKEASLKARLAQTDSES